MQIQSTKTYEALTALLSCANHRTTVLQRGPHMRYKLQSLDNEILITILRYEEQIPRNQSETHPYPSSPVIQTHCIIPPLPPSPPPPPPQKKKKKKILSCCCFLREFCIGINSSLLLLLHPFQDILVDCFKE